jgi:hypothetical protein
MRNTFIAIAGCLVDGVRVSLSAIMAVAIAMAAFLIASPADAAVNPFWEQGRPSGVSASKPRKAWTGGKSATKRSTSKVKTAVSKKRRGNTVRTAKRSPGAVSKNKNAYSSYSPSKSLTGGGVRWVASAGCLSGSLKSVVHQVASKYGPVTVSSTCRSAARNRAVGGASKSKHLSGQAVDFRVHGNVSAVYAYLKSSGSVGGLKHYGGGLFHIDTGPRRSW